MNNPRPLTLLYFGVIPPEKSARNAPYIAGLRAREVEVLECFDTSPGLRKYWALTKKFWPLRNSFDVLFVGHTSTLVVSFAWMLTRKPIIFNALAPLYDGMVSEREVYSPYNPHAIFIWLIDLLSFH
jgi:hypothetical protein